MERSIVIDTYNRAEVVEGESVSTIYGHPLNQLQRRSFVRHAKRLREVVRAYGHGTYEISFLDGRKETTVVQLDKTFPHILEGRWRKRRIDLCEVYNILPVLDGETYAPDVYPYVPSHREFLFLQDMTDFRIFH